MVVQINFGNPIGKKEKLMMQDFIIHRNQLDSISNRKMAIDTQIHIKTLGVPFCNNSFEGKILGFQDVEIANDKLTFDLNIEKYLRKLGLKSLSEIKAIAYGKSSGGTKCVTLIFKNGMISFYILKSNTLVITPTITSTPDNNPILLDNIVLFGEYVIALSESGLVTTDGISRTFTEMFGWQQPLLSDPKLFVDEKGNITITAIKIKTKEGKPGKYYIDVDGDASIKGINNTMIENK